MTITTTLNPDSISTKYWNQIWTRQENLVDAAIQQIQKIIEEGSPKKPSLLRKVSSLEEWGREKIFHEKRPSLDECNKTTKLVGNMYQIVLLLDQLKVDFGALKQAPIGSLTDELQNTISKYCLAEKAVMGESSNMGLYQKIQKIVNKTQLGQQIENLPEKIASFSTVYQDRGIFQETYPFSGRGQRAKAASQLRSYKRQLLASFPELQTSSTKRK